MMSVKSFERLRSAGGVEKWPLARHALGTYKNVAVSATYTSTQQITFDELQTTIFSVLAPVVIQHPILSAIAVDEDQRKPYWARLDQIDIRRCVHFSLRKRVWEPTAETDEELDALLEKEHNTDFKAHYGELPAWRLAVLHEEGAARQFIVSFVFHHGIADTMSGLAFHRCFYKELLQTQGGGSTGVDTMIRPPRVPLLPPMEELHPLPLSWRFIFKEVKSALFSSPKPGSWAGNPVPLTFERQRSRFRSFTFSADTTSKVHAACRERKVSITSLLQVVLANALFDAIPKSYTLLSVEGAISFRRFIKSDMITQDSIGCYVTGYRESHDREASTDSPWKEAQRVRKNIDDELSKDGKDTIVAMSRFIFNYKYFFNSMKGKPRESSLELSNVGRFKAKDESLTSHDTQWRIGKMVFSHTADITGAAINCSCVTGEDGVLSLGFAWLEGAVDEEIIQGVMNGVKVYLQNIASG